MTGWNGSGTYVLRYDFTADAAGGIKILASRQDEMWDDLKTGLENCYTLDGQTNPSAALAMNSQKITGLAAGTAAADAIRFDQLQKGGGLYVVTTGSANTYVAAPSPAITAYAAGNYFIVEINATNTAASTINVNGLGAKNIFDNNGVALVGGELLSGQIYTMMYDGTQFVLLGVHSLVKAAGKETIWIPAAAMIASTTSGAASAQLEMSTNKNNLSVFDFDASADEYVHFEIAFPKSWDEGTLTFQVHWTSTATDTDGVAWGLQAVATADNDTMDVAYGTAIVVTDDAQSAANERYITAESAAMTIAGSPSVDEGVNFRLLRDVSDANDDMTEDARLIGIKVFFTTDARNDT